MKKSPCIALAALAGCASLACAQRELPGVEVLDDGRVFAGGELFESWGAYAKSDHFRAHELRCGFDSDARGIAPAGPEDCTYGFTNPAGEYDPQTRTYRIPVVVHVIQSSSGAGFVPAHRVRSQIDVLNEDFRALAGSNGEEGVDVRIEFALAERDPNGNPTDGITYTNHTTWFNDSGSYWNTLAWDTARYMNIYTNTASGALGYVPDLPQGGLAGQAHDRVVILYSAFGRNAPIGAPYDQGRTLTHEVGHYLGLWHTFQDGCFNGDCARNGDVVCDTNPQRDPTWGCPGGRTSCGGQPAPIENYLDYSDDLCMTGFTPIQARRMRCTLEHYRSDLYEVVGACAADITGDGTLDAGDFFAFLDHFAAGTPPADVDGSGAVDVQDFFAFLDLFEAGCP